MILNVKLLFDFTLKIFFRDIRMSWKVAILFYNVIKLRFLFSPNLSALSDVTYAINVYPGKPPQPRFWGKKS